MNVIRTTFNFFSGICFGCAHERLSRPFSIENQCYMVCLDCAMQVPYSPVTMRKLTGREVRRMRAGQPPAMAAARPGKTHSTAA